MHVYDYRGSKVTVDQCQPCDHIFLDAGELALILRDWETGFTLSENSRTAMVDLHVKKAAATEGTEYVSLIVLSLTSVWVALQAVLEVSRTPIWLILAVIVPLLVSVVVWRIIQAQRRRSHAFHVAKIAELEPQLPAPKPERTANRIAAKPPVARAPVIQGASAGYREPAPETRAEARKLPAGEPTWPEPGD
jgi:Zn-finger nucleic acid-binding protein